MATNPTSLLTTEEYLAIERRAESRSEFLDGEVFAMTGASRRHNLIVANLTRELTRQLKGRACELYPNDMRVWIPSARLYTYPNIAVVCGDPRFQDEQVDTLLNPTLIVEVLSDSTESYDRGRKFGYYRTLDSLAEYLLVAQDEYRIERYAKQAEGRWVLSEASSIEATIELGAIQCNLALEEVFDRVTRQ